MAMQTEYWNGEVGQRWAKEQERLDAVLEPIGRAALARAAAKRGERVLDVGCGCGATTLALADAVAPDGEVLAVDLSGPMLARAEARAARHAGVSFLRADAGARAWVPEFDLVFSRFGVMFFTDPPAAFAALRGALRPGGRLTFVCWRAPQENLWMRVPFQAATTVVPPPEPTPPDAPGPFQLAPRAKIEDVLAKAGFEDVRIEPHDVPLIAGRTVDDATDYAFVAGPTARLAATVDDAATLTRMRAAVHAALASYATPAGVALASATWIVTAKG